MKEIEAGSFVMGSPQLELGRELGEMAHYVSISRRFLMGETEVTQGQWMAVTGGMNPSNFAMCGNDCPVENVDWYSTLSYANALSRIEGLEECYTFVPTTCMDDVSKWGHGVYTNRSSDTCDQFVFRGLGCLGYRLPTEAEWEYAYRAGTTSAYYDGTNSQQLCGIDDVLDNIGWYCANANGTTHPVRSKKANPWGLYDMSGNVQEWCWDGYESYSGVVDSDPTGADDAKTRILRGGSWSDFARDARAAARQESSPQKRTSLQGLRLVRTLPQE